MYICIIMYVYIHTCVYIHVRENIPSNSLSYILHSQLKRGNYYVVTLRPWYVISERMDP